MAITLARMWKLTQKPISSDHNEWAFYLGVS